MFIFLLFFFSRRLTLDTRRSFIVAIFTREDICYVSGRPDGLFWTRKEIRYLPCMVTPNGIIRRLVCLNFYMQVYYQWLVDL